MRAHSPTYGVSWMVRRAIQLLRTEGASGLLKGIGRLLWQKRRKLFSSERFVIYETETAAYGAGIIAPPVEALEVHVLHSEQDVERLAAAGYEDVRRVMRLVVRRLRSGAIGFVAFVDRDVANAVWVAPTAEAKASLDLLACRVNFVAGEAYWSGAYTVDRFRGLGIYRYVMAWALRYCHEQRYRVLVAAVAVDNASTLRNHSRYRSRVRARGRHRHVLHWSHWTEECQGDL
ncbi:hypothetical protein ACFLUT_02030 [Chloroflexota bacterium]